MEQHPGSLSPIDVRAVREGRTFTLLAPRGRRTPADLWWVVLLVVGTVAVVLDWKALETFLVSTAAAAALGAGHVAVTRRRRGRS